jgi:hypothetical protein
MMHYARSAIIGIGEMQAAWRAASDGILNDRPAGRSIARRRELSGEFQ